jgi:hypothetical protein
MEVGMNRVSTRALFALALMVAVVAVAGLVATDQPARNQGASQRPSRGAVEPPLWPPDEAYVRAALPPGEEKYAAISGKHIKDMLKEVVNISRQYRDEGHQFWGRITGFKSDQMTKQWLLGHYRRIGLEKVHLQEFNMPPQWTATSFEASITGAGKTVPLTSIYPMFLSSGTPAAGVDLDPVWVGLGTAADFMGRDVKGKVVFIHGLPTPGGRNYSAAWNGAIERAEKGGAAFVVVQMGAAGTNPKSQPGGEGGDGAETPVPRMAIGAQDGTTVREMIEQGVSPKVHLELEVKKVPNLKTASVWGELPGMTDENIVIMSHDDGFFDGALDNASGMAGMLALAEYYAKVPRAERRRTLTFLVTPGHHAGGQGIRWVHENRDTVLAKTALILNCEHFSQTQTYWLGAGLMPSNTISAKRWYVGGSDQLKQIATKTFREFGVALYSRPEVRPGGELSQVYTDAPSVHIIDHIFYHTDMDTPELVPESGLESGVRAYAKIIDEVNKLDIAALRRPSTN